MADHGDGSAVTADQRAYLRLAHDLRATGGQEVYWRLVDRADVVRALLQNGADAAVSSGVVDLTNVTAPEDKSYFVDTRVSDVRRSA